VTDIVRTAVAYRDRLRSEITRIEQFIRMGEELSRGAEAGETSSSVFRNEARPAVSRPAAPAAHSAVPPVSRASETRASEVKRAEAMPAEANATETNAAQVRTPEPGPAAARAPETAEAEAAAAEQKAPEATTPASLAMEPAPAAPTQSRWGLFRGTSSSPDDLRKAIAG